MRNPMFPPHNPGRKTGQKTGQGQRQKRQIFERDTDLSKNYDPAGGTSTLPQPDPRLTHPRMPRRSLAGAGASPLVMRVDSFMADWPADAKTGAPRDPYLWISIPVWGSAPRSRGMAYYDRLTKILTFRCPNEAGGSLIESRVVLKVASLVAIDGQAFLVAPLARWAQMRRDAGYPLRRPAVTQVLPFDVTRNWDWARLNVRFDLYERYATPTTASVFKGRWRLPDPGEHLTKSPILPTTHEELFRDVDVPKHLVRQVSPTAAYVSLAVALRYRLCSPRDLGFRAKTRGRATGATVVTPMTGRHRILSYCRPRPIRPFQLCDVPALPAADGGDTVDVWD